MELDGLRGISVLFVVAYHTTTFSGYFQVPAGAQSILANLGGLGVQIFFIISGYIITRLLMEEHEKAGRVSLRSFYIRRFFRIIPAYWFYLASVLLLAAAGAIIIKADLSQQTAAFLISTLFLSDFLFPGWFCGHTWSLSVEEQFYIFFPLCFKTIYQSRHQARIMAIFLILIYLSSFFVDQFDRTFSFVLYRIYPNFDWNSRIDSDRFFSYQYIAIGVFMAVFWKALTSPLRRIPIFFYVFLIFLIALNPFVNLPPGASWLYGHIRPLLLACVVAAVMLKPEYFGLLRWRMVQMLGACSYSIYLWQQLFTGGPTNYGPISLSNPLIALPLLIICVTLSYYFIEKKFIGLGRRFSHQGQTN